MLFLFISRNVYVNNKIIISCKYKYLASIDYFFSVICMLEGSGKWPEDRDAIQCLKSLLHIKMGTELKDKHLLSVSVAATHVDVLKVR